MTAPMVGIVPYGGGELMTATTSSIRMNRAALFLRWLGWLDAENGCVGRQASKRIGQSRHVNREAIQSPEKWDTAGNQPWQLAQNWRALLWR